MPDPIADDDLVVRAVGDLATVELHPVVAGRPHDHLLHKSLPSAFTGTDLQAWLAGNAIEKNIKKQTVYQVQVRMEDGSLRTLEQSSPATVGARVTVEGNQMRAEGSQATAPAPSRPAARPMVVSTYPPNMDRP